MKKLVQKKRLVTLSPAARGKSRKIKLPPENDQEVKIYPKVFIIKGFKQYQ